MISVTTQCTIVAARARPTLGASPYTLLCRAPLCTQRGVAAFSDGDSPVLGRSPRRTRRGVPALWDRGTTVLGRVGRTGSSLVMASSQPSNGKTKVLFVCLGNICRSPTAEAVFKKTVEDAGLADQFEIDSCGTGGGSSNWYLDGGFSYHEGDASDPRMTRAAAARGVHLTSRSRPLTPADLSEFDYILGMDAANIAAIKRAAQHWSAKHAVPGSYADKLSLMSEHLARDGKYSRYDQVPDPYYGGASGFELVLDLLDDACSGLLGKIQQKQQKQQAGR